MPTDFYVPISVDLQEERYSEPNQCPSRSLRWLIQSSYLCEVCSNNLLKRLSMYKLFYILFILVLMHVYRNVLDGYTLVTLKYRVIRNIFKFLCTKIILLFMLINFVFMFVVAWLRLRPRHKRSRIVSL